jgi:hypothetical protein
MGVAVSNEETVMSFYIKNRNGEYVPIDFKKIVTKDWENNLIVVRVGTDEHPASESDATRTLDSLHDVDTLDDLENSSFLITLHNIGFEILGSLKEIGEKYVLVKVTGDDDLSKLEDLQKDAKRQLRGKTKKVVIMPTPLTVDEYKEIKEIKDRVDNRKKRRGK